MSPLCTPAPAVCAPHGPCSPPLDHALAGELSATSFVAHIEVAGVAGIAHIYAHAFPLVSVRVPMPAPVPPSLPLPAATLEELREAGELQRQYYLLLHGMVSVGLAGVLLGGGGAGPPSSSAGGAAPGAVLEAVVQALTRGAATHVDPSVRRTCVQVYCRLVKEWCPVGGTEAVPGFRRYAMEHLGGEACVLGLLRSQPPLDARDGATLPLLSDLAAALKLVEERCGEEFVAHLVNVVGPAAGLPPHVAQQLAYAVKGSEAKDVRECLRGMLAAVNQAAGGRS